VSELRSGYTLAAIKIDGDTYYGLGKNKQSAQVAAAKYVIKCLKRLISGEVVRPDSSDGWIGFQDLRSSTESEDITDT